MKRYDKQLILYNRALPFFFFLLFFTGQDGLGREAWETLVGSRDPMWATAF